MIFVQETTPGVFAEVTEDITVAGVHIPLGNLAVWDEQERNARGIYSFELPTPPTGQVLESWSVSRTTEAGVHLSPVFAAAPAPQISFLEFLALLTPSEEVAIVSSADPQVKIFLAQATGAQFIDLADTRLAAGLNYLVSLGLLTNDRPGRILTNQAPA